jgi:hypothetical protein
LGTSARIIQVRPSRDHAGKNEAGGKSSRLKAFARFAAMNAERDSALSCARQRAGSGPAEIQVLDESWNMIETIDNEEARPPG